MDKLIYHFEAGTDVQCVGKFAKSSKWSRQAQERTKKDLDKGFVRSGHIRAHRGHGMVET
jgi:hypothetical protein